MTWEELTQIYRENEEGGKDAFDFTIHGPGKPETSKGESEHRMFRVVKDRGNSKLLKSMDRVILLAFSKGDRRAGAPRNAEVGIYALRCKEVHAILQATIADPNYPKVRHDQKKLNRWVETQRDCMRSSRAALQRTPAIPGRRETNPETDRETKR